MGLRIVNDIDARSVPEILPLPPESVPLVVTNNDTEIKPRRSGCLWGIAGAVGCLVLVLIVPITLVVLGVTSTSGIIGSIADLLNVGKPPVAAVVSTQTIVQGIQPLGQLVSVSVQLAKADVKISVATGVLGSGSYSANHVVQGAVEAGVDLTKIGPNNLGYDTTKDSYTLIVPEPALTSCRIDYIRQYDWSATLLNVDWDEARLMANYTALIDFRDDAIKGGILERAEAETQLVLGNFVRAVSGHPVEIVFQKPETPVTPPSCEPDPPQGWVYLPDRNVWSKQ
ncbi:MAG: DUF4230 domain-containing protein [Chloroflexi bacterium]|nr:DUF4230 domain-containing protein [Chloroflexota bacterium]